MKKTDNPNTFKTMTKDWIGYGMQPFSADATLFSNALDCPYDQNLKINIGNGSEVSWVING